MNIEAARLNMIKQQLRTCEIVDERLLQCFASIRREDFVPAAYRELAYADMNIPLDHEQVMMTPIEESSLIQALNIQPHESILEIGTGSGYVTALLAKLGASVLSVDCFADFTTQAQEKLRKLNITNVELITADGHRGYVEKAPYDVIVFTGSLPVLPKIVRPQLLSGGRIVAVLGQPPVMEATLISRLDKGNWQQQVLFETNLKPLLKAKLPQEFIF